MTDAAAQFEVLTWGPIGVDLDTDQIAVRLEDDSWIGRDVEGSLTQAGSLPRGMTCGRL